MSRDGCVFFYGKGEFCYFNALLIYEGRKICLKFLKNLRHYEEKIDVILMHF
jgi:hypothetical protein